MKLFFKLLLYLILSSQMIFSEVIDKLSKKQLIVLSTKESTTTKKKLFFKLGKLEFSDRNFVKSLVAFQKSIMEPEGDFVNRPYFMDEMSKLYISLIYLKMMKLDEYESMILKWDVIEEWKRKKLTDNEIKVLRKFKDLIEKENKRITQ